MLHKSRWLALALNRWVRSMIFPTRCLFSIQAEGQAFGAATGFEELIEFDLN